MSAKHLLAAGLLALVGCGQDECEAAVEVINDKAVECALDSADRIEAANDGAPRECSADDAAHLSRQAECTSAASCDALAGRDVAGHADYADCLAAP